MVRGHQERLAPMAADVMAEAGIGFESLDRIVVTLGPGSFTGVRVGLAFAKGLALALAVPCVGVGTLQAAALETAGFATAVIDARQGLVYVQGFQDGTPRSAPEIATLADAAAAILAAGWDRVKLVGPGAGLLAPLTPAAQVLPWVGVDAVSLARFGAGLATPDVPPGPIYLRTPDARTLVERGVTPSWVDRR